MNWGDIAATVSKVAPSLGAALAPATGGASALVGGAVGALGSLIAGALGVEPDPRSVAKAINADPTAARAGLDKLQLEQAHEVDKLLLRIDELVVREQGETMRTALISNASEKHTTRPKIALGFSIIIGFTSVVIMLMWGYAVLSANVAMVAQIQEGWPFIAAVIGTPTAVVTAYFGVLRRENQQRLQAATGQLVSPRMLSQAAEFLGGLASGKRS